MSILLALLAGAAEPDPQIAATIAAMTPAEKAAQLQSTAPAQGDVLPAYDYWNEALHGLARNGVATVFPQAIGLAATWDAPLMERIGCAVDARNEASARLATAAGFVEQGAHPGVRAFLLAEPIGELAAAPRP